MQMESLAPISMDVWALVHWDGRSTVQVDQAHSKSRAYALSGSGVGVSFEGDDVGMGCADRGCLAARG